MTAREPLIEARGVALTHREREIVRDVDLVLREGELVALLGPNASGKSTLLRALAGLVTPARGIIRARSPRERHVAYLAQRETLPESLHARDVVRLGRLPHHGLFGALGAGDRDAVERALAATRCEAIAGRIIGELSGGERQRVALARALAQEPSALLLDEPLTHLDVRHQRDLIATLRRQVDRGAGVLLVLHELSLASHADRCVLLHEGRIALEGRPEEILGSPRLADAFGIEFELVRTARGSVSVLPVISRGEDR